MSEKYDCQESESEASRFQGCWPREFFSKSLQCKDRKSFCTEPHVKKEAEQLDLLQPVFLDLRHNPVDCHSLTWSFGRSLLASSAETRPLNNKRQKPVRDSGTNKFDYESETEGTRFSDEFSSLQVNVWETPSRRIKPALWGQSNELFIAS